MVTLHGEEKEVIQDLHAGLASAVRESDLNTEDVYNFFGKTKLHKIYYIAIKEFNLPITYSWYLAGAYIPSEYANVSSFKETLRIDHSPTSSRENEPQFLIETKDVRQSTKSDPTLRDLRELFSNHLEEVVTTPINDYLEKFYQEFAPPEYKEVYLASLNIRRFFQELINEIEDSKEPSRQISLNQRSNTSTSLNANIEQYSELIDQLQMQLTTNTALHSTQSAFDEFRRVSVPYIRRVTTMEAGDIGESEQMLVSTLNNFFFNEAWKYPCLHISKQTASGPKRKDLILRDNQRIQNYEERYADKIGQLQAICEEYTG